MIECLESMLRNDYPNYQVIVIDNNSPNNLMEYIKAWAEGKLDVWVNPNHPLRHLSYPQLISQFRMFITAVKRRKVE